MRRAEGRSPVFAPGDLFQRLILEGHDETAVPVGVRMADAILLPTRIEDDRAGPGDDLTIPDVLQVEALTREREGLSF